jgi:hypothetical protein
MLRDRLRTAPLIQAEETVMMCWAWKQFCLIAITGTVCNE